MYIQHTFFQLFHCTFPQAYLRELYHDGELDPSTGSNLHKTKAYDFYKVDVRGEWFDVFVALMQYLVTGQSKVGVLDKAHPSDLTHKVPAPICIG